MSEVSSVTGVSPAVVGYQKTESDAANVAQQENLRQQQRNPNPENDSIDISAVAQSRLLVEDAIARKLDAGLENGNQQQAPSGEQNSEVAQAKLQRLRTELEGLKSEARFGDQDAARAAARAAAQVAREIGAIDAQALQAPVGPSEAQAILAVQIASSGGRQPTSAEKEAAAAGFAPVPDETKRSFEQEQRVVIDAARFIVEHSRLRDGVSVDDPKRPDYSHLLKEVDTAGPGRGKE